MIKHRHMSLDEELKRLWRIGHDRMTIEAVIRGMLISKLDKLYKNRQEYKQTNKQTRK